MTHYLKTIVALILCVITCSPLSAKVFYTGGISYETISDNSTDVNVSYCSLSGDVNIPSFVELDGIIYNVVSIGRGSSNSESSYVFYNSVTSITLPESITTISNSAFKNCSDLTSISLPKAITTIGDYVFQRCTSLKSISIPESVTKIGMYAFQECTSLTSIYIPESVTDINEYTFQGCTSLTSIYIPESVTYIGWYAFLGCTGLTSISLPESVRSIGFAAFRGCTGLTSISLPESLKTIGEGAFEGCTNLTSISFPQNLTTIGNNAFLNCHELTNIDLTHTSLTEIGYDAFAYCYMVSSISLPNTLTVIGSCAFYGANITSIMLPPNLSELRGDAFGSCKHIERVYCAGKMAAASSNSSFSDETYANATLYVPTGRIPIYEQVGCWHNFNTIKEWDPETNINDTIEEDCESKIIVDIYDINGRKTTMDSRGIIFVRYADGTIKKQIN